MNKKRLLILHPIGKWIGGGETGLFDLLKNLNTEKYTFHVVLPHKGPVTEMLFKLGVPFSIIHIRRWHSIETKLLLPILIIKLAITFLKYRPNIVFCNSHDVVPFGIILNKIFKTPVVSFIGVELPKEKVKKYMLHLSQAVIVKTDWQKKQVEEFKPDNIFNLKDGFDIYDIDLAKNNFFKSKLVDKLKLEPKSTIFLMAGRFEDVKNFELAVNAFKHLKDKNAFLLIVGAKFDNSEYEKNIIELIRNLDLEDKIKILPFSKLEEYFLGCDVFLQTSKSEGLPRTVIEAMIYGKPLILSDIEPHKEILKDAKGFLVSTNNPEELANKMKMFINNNNLISEYGCQNREVAKEHYDIKNYVREVEKIFESLI